MVTRHSRAAALLSVILVLILAGTSVFASPKEFAGAEAARSAGKGGQMLSSDVKAGGRGMTADDFREIDANYSRGNGSSGQTQFVYCDEFLFTDNSVLSPELAKISAVLASAAYEKEFIEAVFIKEKMDYSVVVGGEAGRRRPIISPQPPDTTVISIAVR